MTDRTERPTSALAIGATVLMLGAWGPQALASSGIATHCSEAADEFAAAMVQTPSLNIEIAEYGLIDAESDMDAPAADPAEESVPAPALAADAVETNATDENTEAAKNEDPDVPIRATPDTALHLPGIPAEDQPRFRRQMYRTDI